MGGMNGNAASDMLSIDPRGSPQRQQLEHRELLPRAVKARRASGCRSPAATRTRPACDPTAFDTYPGLNATKVATGRAAPIVSRPT